MKDFWTFVFQAFNLTEKKHQWGEWHSVGNIFEMNGKKYDALKPKWGQWHSIGKNWNEKKKRSGIFKFRSHLIGVICVLWTESKSQIIDPGGGGIGKEGWQGVIWDPPPNYPSQKWPPPTSLGPEARPWAPPPNFCDFMRPWWEERGVSASSAFPASLSGCQRLGTLPPLILGKALFGISPPPKVIGWNQIGENKKRRLPRCPTRRLQKKEAPPQVQNMS